jgi:hypothetical protein
VATQLGYRHGAFKSCHRMCAYAELSFGQRFAPIVAFMQYYYKLNGARRNVGETNMPNTFLLYYKLCSQGIN